MTAPSTGAVGDARKRDQETHWDPAVRALIAEAAAKAWDEGHLQGGRDEYRGDGEWAPNPYLDGGR